MEIIKQYDKVALKDGQEGIVVEVLGEQDVFIIDTGTSPEDWETVQLERKEIVQVMH